MGIDTIIGLAGLAVALPGLVQTTIHFSRYMAEKFRSIPDSDTRSKVKDLVLSLQRGTLRETMEIVEDLYAYTSDTTTRNTLEEIVKEIPKTLEVLDGELTQIMAADGDEKARKKARVRAQKSFDQIEKLAETLLAHVRTKALSRPIPSRFELPSARFSLIQGTLTQVAHSPVQVCRSEWTQQGNTEELCIIEEKRLDGLSPHDAKDTIVDLVRSLQLRTTGKGILHLAGFQTISDFHFRLVFKFPENRAAPRSLRDILLDPINIPVPPIPRNYRFILPRRLAEAVYHVHQQNLVHKCIRPESILLFEPEEDTPETRYPKVIGLPVLTDWQHARKINYASHRQPSQEWTVSVYQHPERQFDPSIIPANRYHIGHDIYSLGVCLLEIGLWNSFIVYNGGSPALSELLTKAKTQWKTNNSELLYHPNGEPLKDSEIEQQVFVHMAGDLLAFEMGDAYSKLVIKCLKCLEHGFGNVINFVDSTSQDWEEQGVEFIQEIRKELKAASTMGEGIYNKVF